MFVPFTEKYRPKSLNEVIGNREVLECLKSFSIEDLPNMLFYGPPGTGKTTTIRALLKDLPNQNILELNASDHRGIETVRTLIKEFSSIHLNGPKVVILDEADSMSKDAQGALRRIIEDFKNTRFCFICNYYKKIIDPIVSRCTRFRFSPVNEILRIKEVCLKEKLRFTDEGLETIEIYSDGDMRKVMNDIQGMAGSYDELSKDTVLDFYGMPKDDVFVEIFNSLISDSFEQCKNKILKYDLECAELIKKINQILVNSDCKKKFEMLKSLSDIEHRLSIGCTNAIQLNSFIAAFIINRN
jgi:replication factor C subunit 3/5